MHAGVLELQCSNCHGRTEEERQALGCDPNVAAAQPVWQYQDGEKTVTFLNCPGHFIAERIWNFWKVYKGYQRKRAALPDFDEQPLKYLAFCDLYEAWVSIFQVQKMEEERQKQNSAAFGKMRFGHG